MDWLTGKRLLILGLARQGLALAKFATAVSATVTLSDLRPAAQLTAELAELAGLPIKFVLGEHPLSLLDERMSSPSVAVCPSMPPLCKRRGGAGYH